MMLMNYVRPSLPVAIDLRVGHLFDEVFRAIERLRWMRQLCWTCLFLLSVGLVTATAMAEELRGNLVVVGRGPERPMIEQLARAFEKAHLGTAVDISRGDHDCLGPTRRNRQFFQSDQGGHEATGRRPILRQDTGLVRTE